MTSPLGLTRAVQGGIYATRQANADNVADEDRQYTLKKRAIEEQGLDAQTAANQAASDVIAQAMEAHKASGATTPFKPGPLDAVRAYDARSAAYVKAKDFKGFMESEGQAAAVRLKARAQFLQEYQANGDFNSFIKNAYSTLPNGDEVQDVELVKGAAPGAPGLKGAPSGPDMARITLKSGRTVMADPTKVVAQITQSLRDPVKAAEQEADLHFKAIQKRLEANAELPAKKELATHNAGLVRNNKALEFEQQRGLATLNNQSAERRAQTGAAAAVKAAGIRAGADGGAGGSGARIQSTRVDDGGYVVGIFRDGSSKRLMVDGKPMRSQDYKKQVTTLAKALGQDINNIGKPTEELMRQAESLLFSGGGGGAGDDGDDVQDFSNLWN